ncbi:MAG: heavy metal translocating P-type ATPase [Usitatibacter sp.]
MPCRHCGLPAPAGEEFCCTGCEGVAGAIAGLGLTDYYRLRSVAAPAPAASSEDLAAFDDPAFQASFVRVTEGVAEAQLLVEGLRCAACGWLVEHALARTPGVESVSVNYGTRKARVRWRRSAARLSTILEAIRAVGYAAWPYEPGRVALVEERERTSALRGLWVAGLGMMQVMMYAVPAYFAGAGDMTRDIASLMRWSGLALTIPVVAYSAAPFFRGAWRDLRHLRLGMDVPVALGIAVAFAASARATASGSGEVYFDSITMFVFLLLGGRYLELLARARAGRALQHLARLEPRVAQRLRDAEGHATDAVPAARLACGDRVLVRSGETLPADGELEGPEALVSEAWLSGESRPLVRRPGEVLYSGSINTGRALVLRVRRAGSETALAAIQRMMERAIGERTPWVAAAQRAAGFFVAAVLAAALAAGILWWPIDPERAVWIAVSVLVVTCPCALALATPTALTVASGALARRNFVVARAGAIERLATATDFVFDKTGTLTEGAPRLLEVVPLGRADAARCRGLAAALARASSHPLDRAIAGAAGDAPVPEARDHASAPGDGVEAWVEGRRLRMGRADYVAGIHGKPVPGGGEEGARTTVWLGDSEGWIARLALGEALRPEAAHAVGQLRARGLALHILSGDADPVARRVARELGIDRVEAGATPERKVEYVRALQSRGARVAMVGDGINDAPVLGAADVSIAMGGGADLAQVRADAVLLSDSLADLAAAVRIAGRTRGVIRQNLGWALAYNAVVIPLALAGAVTPLVAGVAMSASSLVVVANALRLSR